MKVKLLKPYIGRVKGTVVNVAPGRARLWVANDVAEAVDPLPKEVKKPEPEKLMKPEPEKTEKKQAKKPSKKTAPKKEKK